MTSGTTTDLRPVPVWALAAATALIVLLASALPADAQAATTPQAAGRGGVSTPALPAIQPSSIPRAFRDVALGMERDIVIENLKKEALFFYRGPEDVSLLPSPNQSLIDVSGPSFVKHGYFQFYEGRLWVMILVLNPDKIDHFSVYTSLAAKYGEPSSLDPKEARWEDGSTRMAIERPLTLRYMDLTVYSKLREGGASKESAVEIDRKAFLGGL